MKIPHDKFCVLPWVSLEATPVGSVHVCCLSEVDIVDNDNKPFSLTTVTDMVKIQSSNCMQKLRQDFLDGKQPASCNKCWNEEAAGRYSKRMHTLKRLDHMIDDSNWTVDAKPLMFLDLKLGNICNLKCRICGSWSSSTYAVEELEFVPIAHKKTSHHYQMLKQGAWARDNQDFWASIDTIADQIRYLEFTGGEPFMIKEHFRFLEAIVDRGIAGQVEVHYNTNGTQFPEHAEDIWQHFKCVEIAFSIDDLGPRFEYQRTNAVWSEVELNIARFSAMRDRNSNIKLQVCITVNAFNIMSLESVANWADMQGFDFIYWNMLHQPHYLNIGSLPNAAKEKISNKYSSITVSKSNRREIDNILDFMMKGQSLDGVELLHHISQLDRRRKQDLRKDHSDLAEILGYNGVD
jgi:pyruvate-formate lyase-activating enzyme